MPAFRGKSGRLSRGGLHPHKHFDGRSGRDLVYPSFDLYPGNAGAPPSVANLSPYLTINGTTVEPTFRYKGGDADATDWDAWVYGGTITKQAGTPSVNQGSPLLGSADDSVKGDGTAYYLGSTSDGDIGTEDFVIEFVVRLPDTAEAKLLTAKRNSGAIVGWSVQTTTAPGVGVIIQDSGGGTQYNSGTLANGTWNHVMLFVNRGENSTNGLVWYVNGASSATGNPSARAGTLTNALELSVLAYQNGTSGSMANIAYAAMWKQADWHQAGASGPTEWADIAKDRVAQLAAVWPRIARGEQTPSTMTRASTATLRKAASGVTTLYTVGANWPRVEQLSGLTGYLSEPTVTNKLLQSEDFSTTWAKLDAGDSFDTTGNTAPDGTATADGFIADATDGQHGCTQTTANLTAATYTFSVFAKAGDKDWLFLRNASYAAASSYFDLSTGALGTKGADAAAAFIEDYGDGWYRCGISFTGSVAGHVLRVQTADADGDGILTGDGATINTYVWGAQCELFPTMTSYVKTTTLEVVRSADRLTFDSASSADRNRGSVVGTVIFPSHNNIGSPVVAELNDATANNFVLLYVTSTDVGRLLVGAVDGSTTGLVTGTSDISDGVKTTLTGSWQTDDYRLYVDGTAEGTADTSGAVPADMTSIDVGHTLGGSQPAGIIERLRVFLRPGKKQ